MTRKIDLSNIRVTIGGGPAGWHSIAEAVRMVSLAFSCDINTARSGILRRGQRGMMNACCGGFTGFLPADLQQEMAQLRPLFPSFPVGQFLWSRAEIQDLSNSFWTFGDAAINFDDRELTAFGVRLSPLHVASLIAGHEGTSVTLGNRGDANPAAALNAPREAAPWSDAKMRAEVRACAYSNRERAWTEAFRDRQTDHGWQHKAFISRWSEFRGTKGRKGRPNKGGE